MSRWFRNLSILVACLVPLSISGCNGNVSSNGNTSQGTTSQGKTQVKTVAAVKPSPSWPSDPTLYEILKSPVPNYQISVPILEYHDASYVPGDIATLKPGQLAAEFQWLADNHFHPINLGQLYAAFYYGYHLPSRPIVLSFDDGYESMYTKVYPLLQKYHFQATFFIVSGFTHKNPAHNNKTFPTLTVAEVQQLAKSNLVDLEDHTEHHLDLAAMTPAQQQQAINGAAKFIEPLAHHPIRYFCYPDGGYTNTTVQILKNSGFLLATTQHQGYANLSQGPLTLHRMTILDSTTLQEYASKLAPSLASSASSSNGSGNSGSSNSNGSSGSGNTRGSGSLPATPPPGYEAGVQAFGQRNYQSAIANENQALAANPNYYPAYAVKGIALCFAGSYTSGMNAIDESLKLNPTYGYGLFNKALAFELYGYYNQAIATYQQAIPLGNGQWWKAWAYYGIAAVYGRRGDVPHVVEYLKQAEALSVNTKIAARTEKDFNPVRSSPAFQALLK